MAEYSVAVEKDDLVFAAGHFITYGGGLCERLHGHNYRVRAELEGPLLGEGAYVFDFTELKRVMRRLIGELDHKMLLPLENAVLELEEDGREVRVDYEDRRYVFPRGDVVLLPVPNTTAEMLARHLAAGLKQEIGAEEAARLDALSVEVEESFGQSATCRERLGGSDR